MSDLATSSQGNPYEAPLSNSGPILSSDTEFLVSESCVLCEDALELPAICIASGFTTDVIQIKRRLSYYPALLKVLYIILLFSVPVTIGQLDRLQAIPGDTGARLTLSVNGCILLAAILGTFVFRKTITASWYLHETYLRKPERRRRLLGIGLAVCVAAAAIMAGLGRFEIIALPSWALAFTGIAIFRTSPMRPVFRGRHEGLNVIMGLSPEFLAKVQSWIEQHAAGRNEQ